MHRCIVPPFPPFDTPLTRRVIPALLFASDRRSLSPEWAGGTNITVRRNRALILSIKLTEIPEELWGAKMDRYHSK